MKVKLRTTVYPSNMALFGFKLHENACQTIPDISFSDAKNMFEKCKSLNDRLPPEDGSIRPQTLGKRVSDDPRHFIFRQQKKCWQIFRLIFLSEFVRQKIGKLPFLDVI